MKVYRVWLAVVLWIVAGTASVWADWKFQYSGTSDNLNDICFVDEFHGWAVGDSSTIIHTVDGGETWERQECPVGGLILTHVQFPTTQTGYCSGFIQESGRFYSDMFKTEDGGKIWNTLETGYNLSRISGITFADEKVGWLSTSGASRVLKTTDGGKTWQKQLDTDWWIYAIESYGYDTIWVYHGVEDKMFTSISNDGGATWEKHSTQINMDDLTAVHPDTLFMCHPGLASSVDGGRTWKKLYWIDTFGHDYYFQPFLCLPINGQELYVVSVSYHDYSNGNRYIMFLRSEDGGVTMTELFRAELEYDKLNRSIKSCNGIVWIPCDDGIIIKYWPGTADVAEQQVPLGVTLYQNTPNPFNASTAIRFSLPEKQHVTLKIYDIQGRVVSELCDETLSPGCHLYEWSGTNPITGREAAAGLYFYSLQTGKTRSTQKMMYLK